MKRDWTRRELIGRAALATGALACKAAQGAEQARSFQDGSGAVYLSIQPGAFRMGNADEIPLAMCEPLAYMTRGELQQMFPHGDPARFVLSDVLFEHGDPDERPAAPVRIEHPFSLGITPVTNAQYERFDPSHRALRGKFGFSREDDEAVIYVSWHDAVAYCQWLAKQEGKPFRLPTEAEWEFATRAGTTTLFSMGNTLPASYLMNARVTDFSGAADKVSLRVGQRPPNPWGLFDVHGLVEEWVADWHAPYTEPRSSRGPTSGTFRVSRGGSHGTFAYYLRSSTRFAMLPETRAFTIGFRVACGELPPGARAPEPPRSAVSYSAPAHPAAAKPVRAPDPTQPYFRGPHQFVKIPADAAGPLFHWHNHDTGLAECPNGDLLAIWYTCAREQGRELSVAASRLPAGKEEWGEAYSFYDTPTHNDHCPALWFDGETTMYHLNGTALAHNWEPLQIILRSSSDNGQTWSTPRYIAPDFGFRNMVCQPILRLSNGWWVFGADAHENSTMWLSKDEGQTWEDTGGDIHGIHASLVALKDGRIMALGRGNNVNGYLPMSITEDFGKTWHAQATDLPPVTYTQRFSMVRLQEGPLALVTFLPDVAHLGAQAKTDRELAKLCVCISYDEGRTWPVRRLLTDGGPDHGITGMSYGRVYLGPGNAEPTGYCTLTQARNGVLHAVSSMNHYAFNVRWIEDGPKNPSPMPTEQLLPVQAHLRQNFSRKGGVRAGLHLWTNERTGAFDELDPVRGCTVEVSLPGGRAQLSAGYLRLFVRSGCTMCNRYWLRAQSGELAYWYASQWNVLPTSLDIQKETVLRLAVRGDTCVQIYAGDLCAGSFPASYEIGFAEPTRGNWLEWEQSSEEADLEARLRFDLANAFRPA